VDYYAIELLAKGYPSLSSLSVQGTPITDEGLLAVSSPHPPPPLSLYLLRECSSLTGD